MLRHLVSNLGFLLYEFYKQVMKLFLITTVMFKFQKERVAARKRFLNRLDVITFDNVPEHIVDAFFGSCSYKNRLIVLTFAYLNGLHVDQVFLLVQWKDISQSERNKMFALYKDFEKPQYKNNYYSYNVHHQLVMFLNGDVRKYGKRITKSNN